MDERIDIIIMPGQSIPRTPDLWLDVENIRQAFPEPLNAEQAKAINDLIFTAYGKGYEDRRQNDWESWYGTGTPYRSDNEDL